MSEWFKEHAWKACVGVTPPWVRIPLSPLQAGTSLTAQVRGAAQLEPENPARSGRKQRYWVNQCDAVSPRPGHLRSEEHTSELQSRLHLVCRLLLEKKKKTPGALSTHECGSTRSTLPRTRRS